MKLSGILLFVATALAANAGDITSLKLARAIPLPDVAGRIDHLSIDSSGERLFVAALGNNSVEVVDLKSGQRVHRIRGLSEPQGLYYVPELGRLYVANGGDGTLRVFEDTTFALVANIPFSGDADNVRYDPGTKQILVGYGKGALGIVDTTTNKTVSDVPLSGHPEAFQLERNGPRIFVNVPTSRDVAVVDRGTRKISAVWPTGSLIANYPLALDEAGHRLFVACRIPARLLVFDTLAGKETAKLELHGDCDDLFFDAARHRVYASCGEGFIDVFAANDDDQVKRQESLETVSGARTCFFDGEKIYLAVPRHGKQDAEIRIFETR